MKFGLLSQFPKVYSTVTLMEACRKNKIDIEVLNYNKTDISFENGLPVIYYGGKKISDLQGIIPRIASSATHLGARLIRQYSLLNIPSTIDAEALVTVRDKLIVQQIMTWENIPMPNTYFPADETNPDNWNFMPGDYPLIVKMLHGNKGAGVVLAESQAALKSILDAFHRMKVPVIVQEFIKEASGKDIRAFVVNGEIVAAMERCARANDFRSNLHQGGQATPVVLTNEEHELILKTAKVCKLDVTGIDMLRSNRGPLILEVNGSPGLEGIESVTGVDIAGKIIQYLKEKVEMKPVSIM
ncbi:MAG: RimK family alpha-L-glutamate ligase [Bacteroidetes bacterium]|nr:RimK family alpha-L-glutamate ligase [Bacteroidota bacterium]